MMLRGVVRPLLAYCAAGLLLSSPTLAVKLRPIPAVDRSGMEPAVSEQLAQAERTAAAAATKTGAVAAEDFGSAGRTFLIYLLIDAARACFENAASLAPNDLRWSYYTGVMAQTQGDMAAAAEYLGKAAVPPHPVPGVYCHLGEVELLLGNLDDAERSFSAALADPNTVAEAHFGLGRIAMARGNPQLAAKHFESTLTIQPTALTVHALLAAAYRRLGRMEDAQSQEEAYANRPVRFGDPLIEGAAEANKLRLGRFRIALKAIQDGRFAEAEKVLLEQLANEPADPVALMNLGTAQENLGKNEAALASYRRAVEVEPTNARALYNLGTLLASLGQRAEGIEKLRAALKLRPEMADARFNLAVALADDGRTAEAVAECKQLLLVAPQDRQARSLCARINPPAGSPAPPPN